MEKDFVSFYKNKKILITGHTGFKGSWLSQILTDAGADVIGYSLEPPTTPNLFTILGLGSKVKSVIGDIRDFKTLATVFEEAKPEFVIHLAAQPLVRQSYISPVDTYSTNVMGTVHVLECARQTNSVQSILNVTTDKVYYNREWEWGYRESDRLNGFDPYSNSKSCSELVTSSYVNSFFNYGKKMVSTARAGNVIGGGDFAKNRIIPDCVRAMENGEPIRIRNPRSMRPYQHVLEPLFVYLLIMKEQRDHPEIADSYNVGPDDSDCVKTGEIVELFCKYWGDNAHSEITQEVFAPHEAGLLKLDCSKIKTVLGWKPIWGICNAVEETVRWFKAYLRHEDVAELTTMQIKEYAKRFYKHEL